MRTFLLTVTLVCTLNVSSQSYNPLLGVVNEWQFTGCYFGCITDVYFTQGDTVVNGKTYKVLDGYHYISRSFLLREDVVEKKVYLTLTKPRFEEDLLLYDFSLLPGDSMRMLNPISPFPPQGGYFLLDSIKTQSAGRFFFFSPTASNTLSSQNAVWVEGVGSLSLINAPGGHPDINQTGQLSCAFRDGQLQYANLDSISSCQPTQLSVPVYNTIDLRLYAQSGNNRFLLTPADLVKQVTVYDLNGRQIAHFPGTRQAELSLNLNGNKAGIYLLHIALHERDTRVFKVVVW